MDRVRATRAPTLAFKATLSRARTGARTGEMRIDCEADGPAREKARVKLPILAGLIAAAALASPPLRADEPLRSGLYEIAYRLELPHVAPGPEEVAKVCLAGAGGAKAFPVLSANNPLAGCPAGHARREGREFSFDIVCPGGNAAKAYALYDLGEDAFEGRIAMNMGGKNMTMTEAQRGRRVGECGKVSAPANR